MARFIEVNSTYRDRNLWPLPAEFEIPISQSGIKSINSAIDPVSLATPVFSWSSNWLLIGNGSQIGGIPPAMIDNTTKIKNSSDGITLVILAPSIFGVIYTIHQLRNYYSTLVILDNEYSLTTGVFIRKIVSSNYLGFDPVTYKNRLEIVVSSNMSDVFNMGDSIIISDPTDFSDPNVPLIFIPNGMNQENAYNNCILYNETINEYRPILRYDNNTNILQLDTTGSLIPTYTSGPLSGSWSTADNFSLRVQAPTLPPLGTTGYSLVVLTSTNSTITVNSTLFSSVVDYYKNNFIRILPYNGSGDYHYNYTPLPINNKSYRITSYSYDTVTNIATFSVYPSIEILPVVGSPIEILPFSYDNFNPFVYTGSLTSQQQMVCYEVQLVSLTLPNSVLKVGQGGQIAYYPHVYVQISNVSSTGAGLKNIIYSNNPNATNVIFRASIYDIRNPSSSPFVRIDGGGMIQTIKFKPNDNLYFRVYLSTGETFNTILPEFFSPSAPNPRSEVTAVIGFKRSM